MYMKFIKVFNRENAEKFNKEAPYHQVVIAGFFMENCPACKSFKPQWEKFIHEFVTNNHDALIAEIDSNQIHLVNFDTNTLEGFPSVFRVVKGGDIVEFNQSRTSEELGKFLKEAIGLKYGLNVKKIMRRQT